MREVNPILPGTRLGPYEILGLLDSGGMGDVYRARDPRLGRSVAIKVTYGTLARVPLAGGAPRPRLEEVKYADWSPDGGELASCVGSPAGSGSSSPSAP